MTKTISIKKVSSKKIVKILLFSPLVLIGLLALFILGIYVTDPIFDRLDHDKFAKLDTQMQVVFASLQKASNGLDDWVYSTSCDSEMSGDFPTGKYYCTALISMEKTVTSVEEVNALQSRYYPIVDNSASLKQKTELDFEYPNDFGKRFVVSSAFKEFTETKSGIGCGYLVNLVKNSRDLNLSYSENVSYGSEINNNTGRLIISLECNEIARDYWYTISNPALLPYPDMPLVKE